MRWWRRLRGALRDWLDRRRVAALAPSADGEGAETGHPFRTHAFVARRTRPAQCDACNGAFSRWRYVCGKHELCWRCTTQNNHRCTFCARLLVPDVQAPGPKPAS